jgi:hypothetical protein
LMSLPTIFKEVGGACFIRYILFWSTHIVLPLTLMVVKGVILYRGCPRIDFSRQYDV